MRRALFLLPALAALLLYGRAVSHVFVWDDPLILQMPLLASPESSWLDAFTGPLIVSRDYYRPVALLSFLAEVRLAGGPSPGLMHATNVVLHALNAWLVTLLASALLAREGHDARVRVGAVVAGTLYAAHPALVEPVAFVSGRFDLLVTFFLLAALAVDARVRDTRKRVVLVAALFLLAALTKEMAVTFPLVLLLWHAAGARFPASGRVTELAALRTLLREPGRRGLYAAVLAAGLAYLFLRHAGLGHLLAGGGAPAVGGVLERVLLVAKSFGGYSLLVVWPFGTLTPLHLHEVPVPADDAGAWGSLVVMVLFVAALWLLSRRAPAAAWLAAAAAVALLPVLNVQPLELTTGVLYAERFLTLPLALLALSACALFDRLPAPEGLLRKATLAALALWSVACVVTVQATLPHWKDGLALWTWVESLEPASPVPATNLVNELVDRGEFAAAADVARRRLARDPDEPHLWNNLGAALLGLGDLDGAERAFETAVENGAEDGLPHLNLADLALRTGRPHAFDELARRARDGGLPPADGEYLRDLVLRSRAPETWLQVARNRLAAGDPETVLDCVRHAAGLGADTVEVALGESLALLELRRLEEAERVIEAALGSAPDEARLHYNRGLVATASGDPDAARGYYARAAELAPEWDLPKLRLSELDGE